MAWTDQIPDTFEEDALDQVLSLERRIRAILRDAQEDADRIIEDARTRASEIAHQAERELDAEVAELAAETDREIDEQRRVMREHADHEIAQWTSVAELRFEDALAAILDLVTLRKGM